MQHTTRETWLIAAVAELAPLFVAQAATIPTVQVSCGWPSRAALSRKRARLGECWPPECAADGRAHIFVSPVLADPLPTLVHELVHAAVGTAAGHRAPFKRLATALGLIGPMRVTSAGPELRVRLDALSATLGEYPHGILKPAVRTHKGSRLLKAECPCGAIIRVTAKLVDSPGLPTCACGEPFTLSPTPN